MIAGGGDSGVWGRKFGTDGDASHRGCTAATSYGLMRSFVLVKGDRTRQCQDSKADPGGCLSTETTDWIKLTSSGLQGGLISSKTDGNRTHSSTISRN
jgi:hypothetical protein